jgi:hypothetical protein
MEFQNDNFAFKYRDALKRKYLRRDLAVYEEQVAVKIKQSLLETMPRFEEAVEDTADESTFPAGKWRN